MMKKDGLHVYVGFVGLVILLAGEVRGEDPGTKKWDFKIGLSQSSPAVAEDGTIYVGSNDKKLYAVNPDGTKKWEFTTAGTIWTSPAIGADGTLHTTALTAPSLILYAIGPGPGPHVAASISAPSTDATDNGPVSYTVTYTNAALVALQPADVVLNKTGTADGTVTVSGEGNTTRTVTISDTTGDGTLGISLLGGTAFDSAGNPAPPAGPSATFVVANAPPGP